jgi:hypothetical protein
MRQHIDVFRSIAAPKNLDPLADGRPEPYNYSISSSLQARLPATFRRGVEAAVKNKNFQAARCVEMKLCGRMPSTATNLD